MEKWKIRRTLIWCATVPVILAIIALIVFVICLGVSNAMNARNPDVAIQAKNSFSRTMRVVGENDYDPFSYQREGAAPRGYDVDLVTELANRAGYNLKIVLTNWTSAVEMVQDGRADVILGCNWIDKQSLNLQFTIPTLDERVMYVFFSKRRYGSFDKLYGTKIAVVESDAIQDSLDHYNLKTNCVTYRTASDCAQAVLKGECDAFLTDRVVGETCLRDLGEKGRKIKERLEFTETQMGFGIAPSQPKLLETVNKTLLAMRSDGTLDSIRKTWFKRFGGSVTLGDYIAAHLLVSLSFVNLCLLVVILSLVTLYYLGRIQQENERTIAAEKAKAIFFSSVSHDIRTPLNAIIGLSELLQAGDVPPNELQQHLDLIESSGKTLLHLVDDLLDLLKLEAGQMKIQPEPTDFAQLAQDILSVFKPMAEKRGQTLVSTVANIPTLLLDPFRLRQILFNLVGNAIKYAGPCAIRVQASYVVGSAPRADRGVFTLTVSDTGNGVSPEAAARLMQPFSQARVEDQTQGTGLGLSICRQLAELMGGTFTLNSALGEGCSFTLTIPEVAQVPSSKFQVSGSKTNGTLNLEPGTLNLEPETLNQKRTLRVMVVDDSTVNRMVISSMLQKLGVGEIFTAPNGRMALAILDKPTEFDWVLTDMWMPEMDGPELLKAIRAEPRLARLKVCTTTADVEARNTYREQGFDALLLKPITLDGLRKLLLKV